MRHSHARTMVQLIADAEKLASSQTIAKPNVGSSTLSRAKAQIAFVEGKKISHNYFLDGEFVKLNADKKMEDENGNILNKMDFWLARGTKQFEDGWFVVE